jgi:hypothetical protein
MQTAIKALSLLGPLPSSASATVERLQAYEEQLSKVVQPISNQDASALAKLFGPDDCFGLAWTLVHLIETAPDWQVGDDNVDASGESGEWISLLKERAG